MDCKTCRWWRKRDDHPYVYGACELADVVDPNKPERLFVPLHAFFVNGIDAELLTRPDFGCTEWEGREG